MTAAGTTAAGTTAAGTTAAADSAADTTDFKLFKVSVSLSSSFFRERDARRGFDSTILAFLVPAVAEVVVLRALLFACSGFSSTGLGGGGGVGGGNSDSAARFCRIEGSTVCHHK